MDLIRNAAKLRGPKFLIYFGAQASTGEPRATPVNPGDPRATWGTLGEPRVLHVPSQMGVPPCQGSPPWGALLVRGGGWGAALHHARD